MDGYLARLRIICSAFGESETRPINLLIREFVFMSRDSYSYRSTCRVVPKASSNPTGRSTTPSGSTLSSNHYLDICQAGNNADFSPCLHISLTMCQYYKTSQRTRYIRGKSGF